MKTLKWTWGWILVLALMIPATASADNYGTINHGTLGVADPTRVINVLQLTKNDYNDTVQTWGPRSPWSPDGKKIVYQAKIGGTNWSDNEICVINPDGTGWDQLTTNDGCDSHASFTPDGRIVFQRNLTDDAEIWIMNSGGLGQTNLTQAHGGPVNDNCENKPQVSPDGTMIAFHTCYEDIWVMDIDGANPHEVSGAIYSCTKYMWSPDSQWILFSGTPGGADSKIYRVKPDGSDLEMLSDNSSEECENWPVYSPSGDRIVYHTFDTMNIMNADGSNKQVLVVGVSGSFSWSPTGDWIAFTGWRSGAPGAQISIINPTTLEEHQLTQSYSDCRVWWSPNNTQILFLDRGGMTRDDAKYMDDILVLNLGRSPTNVPTLSEWGGIVLMVLISGLAIYIIHRRRVSV